MEMGMGELGWSPAVFWASTLPDLLAAYRGYHTREKGAYQRAGTIAAMMLEPHRDKNKRPIPFSAATFYPWLRDPDSDEALLERLYGNDEDD